MDCLAVLGGGRVKKKYFIFIPIILLLLMWTAGVMARVPAYAAKSARLLTDGADLLTDKEEGKLLKKLRKLSDKRDCDIAVITTGDLEGKDAAAYVDDQIDSRGLGTGREHGSVTLLVFVDQNDVSNREVRVATDEAANICFSDSDIDRVIDQIILELSNGSYAKAIDGYADSCDTVFAESLDENEGGARGVSPGWLFGDLGIGTALALLLGQFQKSRLKTARRRSGASGYKADGGIEFSVNKDTFLDKHVERRRREKEERSGPGGHEAGTTHTTSSGSKHGGGGRKF